MFHEKVRRTLMRNGKLAARIEACRNEDADGQLTWVPEIDRVSNVVLKLARGHAAYELSLPQLKKPTSILIRPFVAMSSEIMAEFERSGSGEMRGWPEVGSRAFVRACGAPPYGDTQGPWGVVQAGRYRYSVDQHNGVIVRVVIAEYLACQVEWD